MFAPRCVALYMSTLLHCNTRYRNGLDTYALRRCIAWPLRAFIRMRGCLECRFSEGKYGANAGLKVARDFLEPVKEKFPWISYSDLWTLAGATAIEELGGAPHPCIVHLNP